jgi:hypothetical protein
MRDKHILARVRTLIISSLIDHEILIKETSIHKRKQPGLLLPLKRTKGSKTRQLMMKGIMHRHPTCRSDPILEVLE